MTKKYLSLEHAIRNAVRDQQYKKKSINEDFEFEMARNELRTAIDAAKRLMAHVDGEGELEAWVQSKITKASDYLDTVADYMDSGDKKKIKEHTEEIMETVGIVGAEFKGRQFNNVVPKITPDSTHPAIKTSSVRRNAKENQSLTIHGKITEGVWDSLARVATKAVGAEAEVAGVAAGRAASKAASEAQTAAKGSAVPKPKPVEEPVAPTKPEFEPYKPDTSPPKETPKPANDPEPTPASDPKHTPGQTPAPAKAPETAPAFKAASEPVTSASPRAAAEPAPAAKTETPKAPEAPKAPGKKLDLPTLPGAGFSYQNMPDSRSDTKPVKTYVSRADAPRQFKEDKGEERKEIEYVARKDAADPKSSKSTLGRTGSVKTKIIDENLANIVKNVVKKKKTEKESGGQNPLVDFDPKLNHTIRNEDYNTVSVNDNAIEPPAPKKSAKIIPFKKKTAEAPKPVETPKATEAPKAAETPKATSTPSSAAPESTLSKVGKGALNVVDKAATPLQFGLDYYERKQAGQSAGKALTGAASSTAGMLAGAKAGAALGTAIAPGVGTAIGGIGGGIVGAIGGGKLHDYVADKIDSIPAAEPDALAKEKADKVAALKAGTFLQKYGDKDEEKESGSKKKVNESSLIDAFLKLHGKNK
jgi:hypothetical protein